VSCEDERERPAMSATAMPAIDAAKMLGISIQTLYRGARAGEVPCRRVGRRFIFVREVLDDWLLMRDETDDSERR
jgi:excisionase family DNA binding protein